MVQDRLQAHQGGTARVGASATPAEEAREFLQRRLGLLWKIGFIFLSVYYLLSNLSELIAGRQALAGFITEARSQVLLIEIGTAVLAWLRCRGGKQPAWVLRTVDAAALLGFGTLVSLHAWLLRSNPAVLSNALIPVTYAVVARAVIVPGHAVWTACLSLAGHLPVVAVATVVLTDPQVQIPATTEDSSLGLFIIRVLIGSALATVVSSIIHGLRRQVRQAQQLGQYRLETRIGQGGMGEVYRASHIMLRRPTAVKLLRPDLAGEESIARFEREVQLASQLTHPNTVAIYDYGRTPEGTFYYAMEYLEGLTLESLVRRHGPQPPARAIHILKQVCSSLREAHARGLIHRDIKPANVILCERGGVHDIAKVVDFGLVKSISNSNDSRISAVHTIAGTPLYMAPEAITAAGNQDARSDLYSVGAVGYFLLTGKNLFDSTSAMEVFGLQLHQAPARPSARLGHALPEDLEAVILRCIEKDPARRPQRAEELLAALSACADDGRWTEADARGWHERHCGLPATNGGRPAPAAGAEGSSASASETTTVAVDLGGRVTA